MTTISRAKTNANEFCVVVWFGISELGFLVLGFARVGHFFLPAFSAALVTLPAVGSFLVTALMTPTATVCLMSRTAKRPRRQLFGMGAAAVPRATSALLAARGTRGRRGCGKQREREGDRATKSHGAIAET